LERFKFLDFGSVDEGRRGIVVGVFLEAYKFCIDIFLLIAPICLLQ
jgi:hypothetical protein